MAYIDESTGEDPSDTFLCLHGQPTWSYLYRKMIPEFLTYTSILGVAPSRRVVAPDLLGFGRSDKPTRDADYTFHFHRDALLHFITALNLTRITLVVQDWGGLLGLTLPMVMPERFKRLLVMNTALASGNAPTQGFLDWRAFNNRNPDLKIGDLMKRSCAHLSQAELEAYEAPFPDKHYKAGVRRFPNLVMTSAEMDGADVSRAAMEFYKSTGQFKIDDVLMACGERDMVPGPKVMKYLARIWKNGCYYAEIGEAGHFVQEWGKQVAKMALQVFEQQGEVDGVKKLVPNKPRL